jgi:uncharacterized Zn finger protein (UPF0148 family)
MHPQVQQSKPGNCPICGMTLVKKTIKAAAPKKQQRKSPRLHQIKKHKNPTSKRQTVSNRS